jgi:hypothetical protein
MKAENKKIAKEIAWTISILLTASACSSTTIVTETPVLPEVPEYVKVPHPVTFELSSLKALFNHPLAPQDVLGDFSVNCDTEFQKLSQQTKNKEERLKAAEELVSIDPERMHWCFYSKISSLQDTLQSEITWSDRQKKVFDTFEYLSPIANGFQSIYHDSRYLRWAGQYYAKISEWVFFRKVQPIEQGTSELVNGSNPNNLEPWIQTGKQKDLGNSVFKKYGVSLLPGSGSTNVLDPSERNPANESKKPSLDQELNTLDPAQSVY